MSLHLYRRRLSLVAAGSLLVALGTPALALAATVTLTEDTTVTLPSDATSYTLSSGGTFDQLDVSGGVMTFTMTSGESVTITASSQITFNNTGGFSTSCAANSSITLNPSASVAIDVSPGGACTATSGSGGSTGGGGGGGGGGGTVTTSTTKISTTTTTTTTKPSTAPSIPPASVASNASGLSQEQIKSILSLLASFNADASVIANVQASLTGAAGVPSTGAGSSFTRDLTVGSTGSDVKALQQYLNAHGYGVASTGPGSVGNETTSFGSKTKAALAKLQAAAGITPAAGYLGPKTRAYIEAHP